MIYAFFFWTNIIWFMYNYQTLQFSIERLLKLELFFEIAENKEDYNKFYEAFS